jgi:S-DNA-T family DNA segregation ATPase FtsK/SpoIIIE
MSIRNLFPDRVVMRLGEPEQVDMVLGDGARDRGGRPKQVWYLPHGARSGYRRERSGRLAWPTEDPRTESLTSQS